MATADEILARATGRSSTDNTFVIDSDLRTIIIPPGINNLGVESDDEVMRVRFKMPAIYCGIDLSTFKIRINYLNAKNEGDVYEVTDVAKVGDYLTFSWLVGRHAALYKGKVIFVVCMKDTDSNGNVLREFNTTVTALPILEGLETGEQAVVEYTDLMEQWREMLFGIGDTEEANIKATSEVEQEAIAQKGIEVLATIPEDYTTTYEMANSAARTKADAIICSSQGEVIDVSDSSDDHLRNLRVFGKTTQVTTTGAQLLYLPDLESKTDRGLTQVISGGICKVNGTASATASFNLTLAGIYSSTNILFTLAPGTYTATDCTLYTYDGTNRVKYSDTFTITSAINITWVATRSYGATETVNEITYPMLNAGDTAMSWEPYTGGHASPNPDYMQELTSVETPTIKLYGKNLLRPKSNNTSGYTAVVNEDGSVTVTGAASTTSPIYLTIAKPSMENPLVLSRDQKYYMWGESSNGRFIGTKTLDSTGNAAWSTVTNWNKHVGTDYMDLVQVYIESNGHEVGDTSLCGTYRFQLEVGDSFTGFEGYKEEQSIALPYSISGIPVPANGNYIDENGQQWICDEIDLERGVFVQRILKMNLTGSESINRETTSTWSEGCYVVYTATNNPNHIHGEIMCDFLPTRSNADLADGKYSSGIGTHGQPNLFVKFSDDVNTLDLFAEKWAAAITSGGNVYAILATPIETALAAEEIEAFKTLYSNYPNTTIVNNDGAWIELQYNADTETWVRNYVNSNASALKSTTITLYANKWTEATSGYSQVVSVNGVTANSKIDLQPSPDQLASLVEEEVSLTTSNSNGVVTVHAIGASPSSDMTMQVLITEVIQV